MIMELAQIDIKTGLASQFEAAVSQGSNLILAAKGCHSVELYKSIEVTDRYRLIVIWDTVEDHIEGFQKSEKFQQWRVLVREFFVSIPVVEHMDLLVERHKGAERARVQAI